MRSFADIMIGLSWLQKEQLLNTKYQKDENGGKLMSERKSRVEKIIWRLGTNTGSRDNS